MHGYEIIAELDERSDGAWRPSPGSIYPALRRMEAKGLVSGTDDDEGKRVYSLSDEGVERLSNRDADAPAPWEAFAEDGASLRPIMQELISQARQIGRFGSPEQREQAKEILAKTKADLYAVMAER